MPPDSVESTGELAAARETIRIAAGPMEKGTVAAQKMIVTGIRDGRPLLRFAATWYCSDVLDQDSDTPENSVDMQFIANNEGGDQLNGYYPGKPSDSNSGATSLTAATTPPLSSAKRKHPIVPGIPACLPRYDVRNIT